MAKVTYSPLIDKISGSIGGTVTFACRKGKPTVYPKRPKRDAKTPAQLAHRARYRAAVAKWRALTVAEKAVWERIAKQTVKAGAAGCIPTRNFTGFQAFMSRELKSASPVVVKRAFTKAFSEAFK